MRIKYGNKNTQNYRVASYLNTGAHLTPLSAMNNLDGVSRLAARVEEINWNLDSAGYPKIHNNIKRTANNKRYSCYSGFVPADILAVL